MNIMYLTQLLRFVLIILDIFKKYHLKYVTLIESSINPNVTPNYVPR